MLADIKLSKAQISKIIQSGGSFGSWLSNLRKKALKNISIPLARGNLPGLVNNLTSSEINEFDRKISGKGAARSGKEDMNGIIKIIKSIEYLGILTDEVTEKVKHKIKKKQEGGFLGALLASLVVSLLQPVIFSVVKYISGRVVRKARGGYMD